MTGHAVRKRGIRIQWHCKHIHCNSKKTKKYKDPSAVRRTNVSNYCLFNFAHEIKMTKYQIQHVKTMVCEVGIVYFTA